MEVIPIGKVTSDLSVFDTLDSTKNIIASAAKYRRFYLANFLSAVLAYVLLRSVLNMCHWHTALSIIVVLAAAQSSAL